jgi:hypothetical protein
VLDARRQRLLWLLWTVGLLLGFAGFCARRLGNWPPVSGDDVWVLSASHNWASDGVFGSDLYRGFFHADQHYYIALPVYHALQALTFVVFGTGVAQGRAVTLASGCVVLAALSWLAWRRGGLAVALAATGLLAFWRVNLINPGIGLPFLTAARTGRYDMTAVACVWLTLVLLERQLRRPSELVAVGVGVAAGLATLTQFFGVFVAPLAAVLLLWQGGWAALRTRAAGLMALAWLATLLPYALYVGLHWSDFVGQAALKAGRTDFASPRFYLMNLRHESRRYEILWAHAPGGLDGAHALGPWLLLLALGPALAYCGAQAWRGDVGCRFAVASVLVFEAALALCESTKAPLYSIVLWPSVCLLVALAAVGGAQWAWRRWTSWPRPLLALAVFGLALSVCAEGGRAYHAQYVASGNAASYDAVGARIAATVGPDASLVGPDRWWWATRPLPYLSWTVIWQRWAHGDDTTSAGPPSVADDIAWSGADYLVMDNHARGDEGLYPPALRAQLDGFMARCTTPVAEWADPTYGAITIVQVVPCAGP